MRAWWNKSLHQYQRRHCLLRPYTINKSKIPKRSNQKPNAWVAFVHGARNAISHDPSSRWWNLGIIRLVCRCHELRESLGQCVVARYYSIWSSNVARMLHAWDILLYLIYFLLHLPNQEHVQWITCFNCFKKFHRFQRFAAYPRKSGKSNLRLV